MRPAILFLTLALVAAGCTKSTDSTTPTSPTPTRTTDTLSGTVQVKGSDFKTFAVTTTGQVDVALTTAGPPSTITMGVGVGTTSGGACNLVAGSSALISAGGALPTGIMSPGTYCVQVYDVGNQTAAVTYTVTVTHP